MTRMGFVSLFQMLSVILSMSLCGSHDENSTISSVTFSQTNMSDAFNETDTTTPFAEYSTAFENENISEVTNNSLTTQLTNMNMETINISQQFNESEFPINVIEWVDDYHHLDFDYDIDPVDIHQQSLQVDLCGQYCDKGSKVHHLPLCGSFICPECHCDEKCSVFGDCCPDINGTVPFKQPGEGEYVCVSHWQTFAVHDNFYMIKSCPHNTTTEVDYSDDLEPVTSTLTNQTYYNEFYARCHEEYQLTVWNNVTHCNDYYYNYNYENDHDQEPEVCESLFEPPLDTHDLRTCSIHHSIPAEHLISRCNNSGGETEEDLVLERLCESSDYRVEIQGVYYRNIFCALCNGETPLYRCSTGQPPGQGHHGQVITVNDLFNFEYNSHENEKPRNCTDMEWAEPETSNCHAILCLQGRYYRKGECKMDNHTLENTEYTFHLDFLIGEDFPLSNWTDVLQMFENNVPILLSKFDPLVYVFTVDSLYDLNQNSPSNDDASESLNYTKAIGLSVTMRSVSKADIQEYEDDILKVIWSDWEFRMYGEDMTFTPRPIHWNLAPRHHAVFVNNPLNKSCCSNIQYQDWLHHIADKRADFPLFAETYISLTENLDCPHVRFLQGKYEIYPNHTLRLVESNITLTRDKYHHTPFDVQVCISDLKGDVPGIRIIRKIEMYLSVTCTCISLICIFLTLVTFLRFPVLQTLPTKNTMFLAASIFVAQASFQFGGDKTENKTLCQVFGVINHFLWLCVIFWMNVCCYHMFHVFVSSAKTSSGHDSHWRTLFKYMLYVYGMSGVIVTATISANFISSNRLSIGYGSNLCYIDKAMVIGLAFVLPLCIVITSNIIFFSCTVYTIYRIRKIQTSSSSDRRNVFVYIKLSTLTGAFWILSIVAKASGSDVLSIISVVLNGSQGLFLFVSYTLNKRVYKLWRKSADTKLPSHSRSSTYTHSTTL